MKILFSFILTLFILLDSFAQSSNIYILRTIRFLPVTKLKKALNLRKSDNLSIAFEELNLYVLELNNPEKYIPDLNNNPLVDFIEKDEELVLRQTPDDPKYSEQYALEQIKASEVWDFTTGGTTYMGDTIVIAVLDDGCNIYHEDLFENIWVNKMEVPGDSIDNDNNGYIDDYHGVNILTKNGIHKSLPHGTKVAGIIGAVGNNSLGMTGINWNIKLLPITDILTKSRIIKGYAYAYKLRKKYNDTNGKQGAFIVCTNFSGGVDKPEFPEDDPRNIAWCEMYDKLGEIGVVSVVSTVNFPRDVDIEGDMPTLCQSPYLVTVTRTNKNDNFDKEGSAYGKKNVDIAAPGQKILSLRPADDYGNGGSGTSYAAPMVSGAIGLMYTVPCKSFIKKAVENPANLALEIKEYIMKYSDKHPDLKHKTVSGGRLNIVESYVNLLEENCSELDFRDLSISQIYPNPAHTMVKIKYETNNYHKHKIIVFNNLGQVVFKEIFRPKPYDVEEKIIDVSQYAKGIYFFSLISNKNKVTKRIVVF